MKERYRGTYFKDTNTDININLSLAISCHFHAIFNILFWRKMSFLYLLGGTASTLRKIVKAEETIDLKGADIITRIMIGSVLKHPTKYI